MTISSTLIPTIQCASFSSLKKAIYAIDSSENENLNFDYSFGSNESQAFKQYILDFVDYFALREFRKGHKEYAYNLKFIKALMVKDGRSVNINGYVSPVSKKSLFEAIKRIETYYHNSNNSLNH